MTSSSDVPLDLFGRGLVESVARLARGEPSTLEGLLVAVGEPRSVAGTRVACRTHFVARDGNGRVRLDALAEYLALGIVDYCIPRSRSRRAHDAYIRTGSTVEIVRLTEEARGLFTALERSGEAGELLLYTLLETVLGVPQILCKMPLKTNSQMHVHGTDGIHAKVLEDGGLALYWGESKLHATVNSAIDEAFASLAPFLLDEGPGAARRDLMLLRDNLDTGMDEVTAALIRYFDGSGLSARLEVRAACLVGFDLADYPSPHAEDGEAIAEAVNKSIESWVSRVGARVAQHDVTTFEIEVFLVPLPSVEAFRKSMRAWLVRTP